MSASKPLRAACGAGGGPRVPGANVKPADKR